MRSEPMTSNVTELAKDTYRISTFHPELGVQANQFLIDDDQPFLMHTGLRKTFAATREAVASVLDPSTIRWIGVSHFESVECGALNAWLAEAPGAQAVCSLVAAEVNVNDFATRPPRALVDEEVLPTGRHRLRFLSTPHVPHGWDAGLFFDESEKTLFCSDLFFQAGDPPPVIEAGIVEAARDAIQENLAGPMARTMPYSRSTHRTLERLSALHPRTLAVLHGASYRGDGRKALLHLAAVVNDLLGRRDGCC